MSGPRGRETISRFRSRAYVLGAQGVGKSSLIGLCSECRPWQSTSWRFQSQSTNGGCKALLVDPLQRGVSIELTLLEVAASWTEADFLRCVGETSSPSDCALLVVDVGNAASFEAAVVRGQWLRTLGFQCISVLSFEREHPRIVSQDVLDRLAGDLSLIKPAHFDFTAAVLSAGSSAHVDSDSPMYYLQLELFLDLLTCRLIWIHWELAAAEEICDGDLDELLFEDLGASASVPTKASERKKAPIAPSSGAQALQFRIERGRQSGPHGSIANRLRSGSRTHTPLAMRPNGSASRSPSRRKASPGPPRCANVLPARYMPPLTNSSACAAAGSASHVLPLGQVIKSEELLASNSVPPPRKARSLSPGRGKSQSGFPWLASNRDYVHVRGTKTATHDPRELLHIASTPVQKGLACEGKAEAQAASAAVAESVVSLATLTSSNAAAQKLASLMAPVDAAPSPPRSPLFTPPARKGRLGSPSRQSRTSSPAGSPRRRSSPSRKASLLFKVDMELGDGTVIPISVHDGADIEVLSTELMHEHNLGHAEQRQIMRYLTSLYEEVRTRT
eukprot:TRINITY_DN63335_c0_g1_i1.p1 TRINITY_DN63335_c0_g1~~TRINITY_DN63335_c0_g1_i1.p1  ORF type:complete len:561 (+),score=77.63 TRINITY_DN63335_c0_g1_i1:54-1736(+)